MASMDEVKKLVLKLLEEDVEFRHMLMGFMGFKEILDRITRLEERFAKLEERQQILEEHFAKLEERFAQLEERQQILEERLARLEERFADLEERFLKLEERQQKLEEEMSRFRRTITVIAHRFGVISEGAFREAISYVVEETLGVARVERWTCRDDEGLVYGYPTVVEVDVVVRDDVHILVEVKSRVSKGDVAILHRKGFLYERRVNLKPRLLIVGGFIDRDAYEAASKLGVEIRPIVRLEE